MSRDRLDEIVNSEQKLKDLTIQEIRDAADKHGDNRRSPVREQDAAKAFSADELVPSEPITVILSKSGWVRSAKGHDIDPDSLNYREGDELQAFATGKSNNHLIFLESSGRIYTVPAHNLPSARSFGEPLTKMLTPSANARFISLLLGDDTTHCLLASTEGNGFVCKVGEAVTKHRSGKGVLSVKEGT